MKYLEICLHGVVVRGELGLHLVELEVLRQLLLLELHLLLVALALLLEVHHALALARWALVLCHGDGGVLAEMKEHIFMNNKKTMKNVKIFSV